VKIIWSSKQTKNVRKNRSFADVLERAEEEEQRQVQQNNFNDDAF
jgi:hypothetical protein